MKSKLIYCFVLFNFIGLIRISGQEKWKLQKEIPVEIDNFYMDNLGYLYLLDNNEIIKINQEGDTLFQFSNKLLGNITDVDVRNTLRPLVFCQENSQLMIMDNTLTIQNKEVDLTKVNLYQASLIASSRVDNGIWIYDRELFQLIKINTSFERLYESGNLEQILGKEDLNPTQLVEENGKVYMVSPANGILVFDVYGSYINTIAITGIENIQIVSNIIFYQKEEKYYSYDLINFIEEEERVPRKKFDKILLKKGQMIIWEGKQLYLYVSKSEENR